MPRVIIDVGEREFREFFHSDTEYLKRWIEQALKDKGLLVHIKQTTKAKMK